MIRSQRGFVAPFGRRSNRQPERMCWWVMIPSSVLAFLPFLMIPLLMHEFGMDRVAAWRHTSGVIAIVWMPLWLVIGVFLSKWAASDATGQSRIR